MEDKKNEGTTEFRPDETINPSVIPEATATPNAIHTQIPLSDTAEYPKSQTDDDLINNTGFAPSLLRETPQPIADSAVTDDNFGEEGVDAVTWTASEFIDHSKSVDWYLALAVIAVLAAGALYLLSRDIITSVTPLVAALAFGFYAQRKPRQLQYSIDPQGLSIANRRLPYDQFRSFAIIEEGPFASLVFLPLKRFGMLTTVYLDPQDEERIVDMVSNYLPFEPYTHDLIDQFMKRIRF